MSSRGSAISSPSTVEAIPSCAASLILAAIVLETGSSIRGDLLFLIGVPLTVSAFVIAARVAWTLNRAPDAAWLGRLSTWLSIMATIGMGASPLGAPIWFEACRRAFALLGLLAVGVVMSGDDRWRRRSIHFLLLIATILHVATPLVLPAPAIDVWTWTQGAVQALLHGTDPYHVRVTDIGGGAFNYGYSLTVYPYMPATLLVCAPIVALLGDFRFLMALSLPATIALIRANGHRLCVSERLIDVVTLVILLHPRSLTLTAFGWTEPLLVLTAAAFAYLVIRWPKGVGYVIAFLFLPALKQYVVVPVALFVALKPTRPSPRALAVGIAVVSLTVIPFLVWDWRATLWGMVFQMIELRSPRLDSDSIVAMAAVLTGHYPARWWSVIAQFVAGGIVYWRRRSGGVDALLVGSAVSLFATFLFGWQAFFNYYYFVSSLLLLGAIVLARREAPCSVESFAP